MTESKFKKVVVASIVGAIMLIVILVTVILYQVITMSGYAKKKNELESEIARYEKLLDENASEEEIRKSKEWIIERARELGYVFPDDIIISDDQIIIIDPDGNQTIIPVEANP